MSPRLNLTSPTAQVLALVFCARGIYGIITFTTSQCTREIGVRMALGASGPMIRRMVVREGSGVILVGLVAGLVGAVLASRFLQTLLFEVRPGDPLTIAAVSIRLGAIGLAACYVREGRSRLFSGCQRDR